jgi:hypothetical protein
MTDHRQEILRLKTLEQQARIMASKSPFPADRERFLAVADSYGTRAQGLSNEVMLVVGHSRPQPRMPRMTFRPERIQARTSRLDLSREALPTLGRVKLSGPEVPFCRDGSRAISAARTLISPGMVNVA